MRYMCSICGYVYDEAQSGKWEMLRESGYMLPQSGNARSLLMELQEDHAGEEGFPMEDVRFLLDTLSFNEPIQIKEEKKDGNVEMHGMRLYS